MWSWVRVPTCECRCVGSGGQHDLGLGVELVAVRPHSGIVLGHHRNRQLIAGLGRGGRRMPALHRSITPSRSSHCSPAGHGSHICNCRLSLTMFACATLNDVVSHTRVSVFVPNLHDGHQERGPHRLVVEAGKWASIEPGGTPQPGDLVVECDIATPGLIDMHGHFGLGPYALPMDVPLAQGTTTLCSQGDAGLSNFDEWMTKSSFHLLRPFIAINIGPEGERLLNCLGNVTVDFDQRVAALASANPNVIRLVSVNLSERSLGPADPHSMLEISLEAARSSGLPLMLALAPDHVMSIDQQICRLRPGDVVTYCYRSQPWCLFPSTGPRPALKEALSRGVLLDVAHGSEAFDESIAENAVKTGYPPFIVSSGTKTAEPGHRTPLPIARVMQRMVKVGMSLTSVIAAVTRNPAQVLGLADGSGDFRLGGRADMTALITGAQHWSARTILAGGVALI